MLIKILIGLAIVVIVFLIVAALQPSDFRVARSMEIPVEPAVVFSQVNDYRKWTAWSPFEKYDPALQRSYSGAPAGTGAVYDWSGNSKAGQGRATITESRAFEIIKIKLEFFRPFACTSDAQFTFKPEGNRTTVTWSLAGKNSFLHKAMGLIVNMEKMLGGQFEAGLTQLKSVAETAAEKNNRPSPLPAMTIAIVILAALVVLTAWDASEQTRP